MSFLALKISLNDELMYTVGVDDWRHIHATVTAIRWTAKDFEKLQLDEDHPEGEIENIHLNAFVSVPDESDATSTFSGQHKTGSFDAKNLAVGDVVTIKVIESDFGDEPTWRNPDDGTIAIKSND